MEYSDDEYDYDEEQRLKKVELLQEFTINDYLAFRETRNVLNDEWDKKVEEELRDKSSKLWNKMYDNCNNVSNLGDLIEDIHENDMFELIRHHIVPQYDLEIFEENPDIAMGLVNKIDQIRSEEQQRQKTVMKSQFKSANVEFSWGK
jgi:hypothetical protein